MRREYYLADTLDDLDKAVALLHEELHITNRDIHIISRNSNDHKKHHLHTANIIQKSNIVRGAEQGSILGFVIGFICFAIAVYSAPFWEVSTTIKQIILLMVVSGPLLLGFWVGAFIGLMNISYKITPFLHELDAGHHLMLVDSEQIEDIKQTLKVCAIADAGETSTLILPFDELEDILPKVA